MGTELHAESPQGGVTPNPEGGTRLGRDLLLQIRCPGGVCSSIHNQ